MNSRTDRLLVLRIAGELKKSELDAAQGGFVQKIAKTGPVKLLVLLENFTGWERTEEWGDTDFFFSHRNDFEKIAVVGDREVGSAGPGLHRRGSAQGTSENVSRNQ